ncbi:hypothetical protein E2C01_013042 [Portunus trituberculatus]|uniref:Uncharacterized protein n=1 Tax=Portunus trituberculatus TaxID=210409 RepID=A0A5B7DFL1_PORTR|nr:hypothetical protein [Portunus trituberculatus]
MERVSSTMKAAPHQVTNTCSLLTQAGYLKAAPRNTVDTHIGEYPSEMDHGTSTFSGMDEIKTFIN